MAIFNFKKRKNPNPQAKEKPRELLDYRASNSFYTQDSTSFAVIDRIATEFAMLSYGVYNSKREKLNKHYLLNVLKRPNLDDLHFNFFYQSAIDYYNGGIYWKKSYNSNGELVSLFRMDARQVTRSRDLVNNTYKYSYNGTSYTDKEVLYIPSRFNYSTLTGGSSIFNAMSGTFDTTRKIDNFTMNSFDKGIVGKRLVVDISQSLPDATESQIEALRNQYESHYTGIENSGKPLFKKKGIEYSEIGDNADNKTQELLENRKFQEHEVAKLFGIPEELLSGAMSNVNIENVFTFLLEFAVKPLATQVQEAINLLFADGDNSTFEFNYNGMLKVQFSTRIDAFIKQRTNGLLSTNEIRQMEDRSPVEAGDVLFTPTNLMPMNEETVNAYMAKQKNEVAKLEEDFINPTDENEQHFSGGDDKQ